MRKMSNKKEDIINFDVICETPNIELWLAVNEPLVAIQINKTGDVHKIESIVQAEIFLKNLEIRGVVTYADMYVASITLRAHEDRIPHFTDSEIEEIEKTVPNIKELLKDNDYKQQLNISSWEFYNQF